MFLGLNVIGIRMTCERTRCEKRANICSKQNIEKRPKNRSLGYAKRGVTPRRTRRMKGDRSRPVRKIGCKPECQISGRSLIPKVTEREAITTRDIIRENLKLPIHNSCHNKIKFTSDNNFLLHRKKRDYRL